MKLRFGVIALGRPTFDVAFAEENMQQAFASLDKIGIETIGPRTMAYDEQAVQQALAEIVAADNLDLLLILQVTFTDASMMIRIASNTELPVAIWAFPEPRSGDRLRLNSYCGLNLAAHALGKEGIAHGWLFAAPDAAGIQDITSLAKPADLASPLEQFSSVKTTVTAERVLAKLKQMNISLVGEHPVGFATCSFDAEQLNTLIGVEVKQTDMDNLFGRAKAVDTDKVEEVRARVATDLDGLDAVDQEQLNRSLRLYCALQDIQEQDQSSAMAVRCWPETFTEYGCAACGPMAMMNQARIPCACEADIYGSLSALMMQELAREPAWMADLVDIDIHNDTAVFWHCGLAPLSMCDPEYKPQATIHTNRKMPLLHQFPLKPGRVTIARLSQSRNTIKMVIIGAEVQRAPMAFTGTSGTFRFDKNIKEVCRTIIEQGLEHHYAMAYGDHREDLRAIASSLNIPVLELT